MSFKSSTSMHGDKPAGQASGELDDPPDLLHLLHLMHLLG